MQSTTSAKCCGHDQSGFGARISRLSLHFPSLFFDYEESLGSAADPVAASTIVSVRVVAISVLAVIWLAARSSGALHLDSWVRAVQLIVVRLRIVGSRSLHDSYTYDTWSTDPWYPVHLLPTMGHGPVFNSRVM